MKTKSIIALNLLLMTSLNAVEISKTKTFKISTSANTKKTKLYVKYKKNSDSLIEQEFSNIIKYAKQSKICKGGKYTIRPNYKTLKENGNYTRIKDGYIGNINFNCVFENNIKYETLLNSIKTNSKLELTQGKLNYIISDEKKEKVFKSLESKGYSYAKDYTEYLNKIFKNCSISKINFSNNNFYQPVPIMRSDMQRDSKVSSPIGNSFVQKLLVNYKFKCKN